MRVKSIQIKAWILEHEIPESDVPCTTISCTECCEKLSPYLTEEELLSGKYIYTLVVTDDPNRPGIAIPRNSQGCIYLGIDKKCTIYDHRPRACRQFDCRKNHSDKIKNKFLEN